MDKEFATKLRASLEALDSRISTLEHLVNDTIIGGLKSAAEEYDDDVKYSEFCDKYKDKYESFIEPSVILYGEDYDLPSDMYDKMKETEGYGSEEFDEDGYVDGILLDIQSKIDALEALKNKVEDEAADATEAAEAEEGDEDENDDDDEEIPSDEDLAKEFDQYAKRN